MYLGFWLNNPERLPLDCKGHPRLRKDVDKALFEREKNTYVSAPESGDPDSRIRVIGYIPVATKLDPVLP